MIYIKYTNTACVVFLQANDLSSRDVVVEDLAGLSASECAESDGHVRGVKRQHEGDAKE